MKKELLSIMFLLGVSVSIINILPNLNQNGSLKTELNEVKNINEIEKFENLDYMTRIPPQFIAKLAHVALQRLFAGERKNQGKLYALIYFVFPDFTKFFF